jgi:phage terminase small subunit
VIEQREREAGKSDGFSNPQIAVGEDARRQLDRLARELASDKSPTAAR